MDREMTITAEELVEKLAIDLGNELYRQYEENRKWDEAKDVVEDFDAHSMARVAIRTALEEAANRCDIFVREFKRGEEHPRMREPLPEEIKRAIRALIPKAPQ